MYYSHFGLNQAPFKITPNTEFFFAGGNRGPILEALIYAITQGEGIIKVTGEVGSGKTMLCHMLPTRLPKQVETVYIANPSVSPEEILHAIAIELQLAVDRSAPRLDVMQVLHDFLVKRYSEGKRVVVFVEESQSMPLATLEEIRLLSNLETRNDKLLQIVLFGQPELDDCLRQPNLRPLRERITHSFRLEPLGAGDIREYLMFRMRTAGYHGPDLFSDPVIKRVARASLGLTRRVNLIADKALLAAFSENTHTVRPKHVEAAVRDSEFNQDAGPQAAPRFLWGTAVFAAGALLGIGGYMVFGPGTPSSSRLAVAPATGTPTSIPAPQAEVQGPSAAAIGLQASESSKTSQVKLRPQAHSGVAEAPARGSPAVGLNKDSAAGHASVTEVTTAAESDLLEARLAATEHWLATESGHLYSIQLLGTPDATQLKLHLNDLSKFVEMNKVFVYRTSANGRPLLTVLYGTFNDRRSAQDVLEKLPEGLKANQPILRTVEGIRGELRRQQAS
ncbi:MAG TPA: AAA family ATPase [Burkholderiales bacterium]|nr:AAA family ATPase [Burkholderiales bacterium]